MDEINQKCQPNGLMFDALGEPRARYVRISHEGAHMVMTPVEAKCFIEESQIGGDETPYTSSMGEAAEKYLKKVGPHHHPLPAQFRWSECLAEMLSAAPAAPQAEPIQQKPFFQNVWQPKQAQPSQAFLSWNGFNVNGDPKSIDEVRRCLHEAGTVPELKQRIAAMAAPNPLFGEMIAQHEGLAEELAAPQAEKAVGDDHSPCKGTNCGITRKDQEHSAECHAEHDAAYAIDPLDTSGNRHPEYRYAGYKSHQLTPGCTEDQFAAYQEGQRARLPAAQPPTQQASEQGEQAVAEDQPKCRDCADFGPICPNTGRPCDEAQQASAQPMQAAKDVLDCPFCGKEPIGHAIEAHEHSPLLKALAPDLPDHQGSYVIECVCGAGFVDETQEGCTALWNRRASNTGQEKS